MNELVLYHGSNHIVESPQFGLGNPHNDYGLGFYCTEHLDMALEWAVGCGHDGFVNRYQLDLRTLKVVDLGSNDYCTLHWLAVLLENRIFDVRAPLSIEARDYLVREYHVDLQDADVVKGYRADDSYFTFAQDFISGAISYRQLKTAMQLGNLGQQFMIKSQVAFAHLKFTGVYEAPVGVWLPRREERDRRARRQYFDAERFKRNKDDLFIMHILDEEMRPGDARLR